ncbi:aminodeoxychorismate synthase component I [Bacteroidales bacterium]|nr:aminodeoxychorismate synthase component I [Bacteroidales bacterium]
MIDAQKIRKSINEAASKKEPFLFAVDFELEQGIFIEKPLEQENIWFKIKDVSNINEIRSRENKKDASLSYEAIGLDDYSKKFHMVRQALLGGDSFLCNLTIKTPIKCDLSLEEIFLNSKAPYCLMIPQQFVCFSPERFVKIEKGHIFSNPMKGTIDANIPHADAVLLANNKETAEHSTIVDLIRNDLSKVANNVAVTRFKYLERIETNRGAILQMSSEIKGQLPENYLSNLGDIIFELLPAGSISGAPKESTLLIIKTAEKDKRGFYTGIFGYFDGEKLDTAVMIRFIEICKKETEQQLYFRSGGGITAYSNLDEEYLEVLQKIYLPYSNG